MMHGVGWRREFWGQTRVDVRFGTEKPNPLPRASLPSVENKHGRRNYACSVTRAVLIRNRGYAMRDQVKLINSGD